MYQEYLATQVVFMISWHQVQGYRQWLMIKDCLSPVYTLYIVYIHAGSSATKVSSHTPDKAWSLHPLTSSPCSVHAIHTSYIHIHFTVTYIVQLHTSYIHIHCTCGSFTKLSTLRGQHILNHTTCTTNILLCSFIYEEEAQGCHDSHTQRWAWPVKRDNQAVSHIASSLAASSNRRSH